MSQETGSNPFVTELPAPDDRDHRVYMINDVVRTDLAVCTPYSPWDYYSLLVLRVILLKYW